nr:MAG TPA: Toll-like receptor 4-like receptor, PROTEIN RECEPTOR, transmembrane [Caudoviricetes sp.]
MSSPIEAKINIYSIVAVIIQSVDIAVSVLNVFSFHFFPHLPVVMATAGCRNYYRCGSCWI